MLRRALLVGLVATVAAGCGRAGPGGRQAPAAPPAPSAGAAGAATATGGHARAPAAGEPDVPRRGFGRSGGRGWNRRFVQLSPDEARLIGLSTVRADLRPLRSTLRSLGTVYAPPPRLAVVSYPYPARVAAVHVRVGQWVERDEPLVALQADEVGATKAAYLQALAALDLAESSLARERRLFERGVGARKALLAAESEAKLARSAVEGAARHLQILGLTPAQVDTVRATDDGDPLVTLHAPIAGRITERTPVLGAMVDPATTILTILDPRVLCADAEVYERDLARLRLGQEATVTVPAYPGRTFHGRVCYIGDVVKAETRTVTVRSEIDNRGGHLKPGMFADVWLLLEETADAVALPERAVLDNGEEQLVFIRAGDGYLPQVVQVGVRQAGYVEIVRGVSAGDEVVVNGNFALKSKLFEDVLAEAGH
jgi:cobalt-zinc-cadmium efflux system membrane fusion protein